MTTSTGETPKRSNFVKLESRRINRPSEKDARQKRARLLRSRIVQACDDMKREFPQMDFLNLMRNRWQDRGTGKSKSQFWMHNSIKTEEGQWAHLDLKDFVSFSLGVLAGF